MFTARSKKITMILAVLIMAVVTVVYAAAVPVYADSIFDTAIDIESGKKISKTLDFSKSMEYKITPTQKGTAAIKVTAKVCDFYFYAYDEDGNSIKLEENITMGRGWGTAQYSWDSAAETFKGTFSFDVKANKTYYIKIQRLNNAFKGGSGKFEVSFNYPSEEKAPSALMGVKLKKGDTLQLVANGSGASWSSSDKSVASVSKNGQVKAVKKGKAVITLKCGSQTESIEVIVE